MRMSDVLTLTNESFDEQVLRSDRPAIVDYCDQDSCPRTRRSPQPGVRRGPSHAVMGVATAWLVVFDAILRRRECP